MTDRKKIEFSCDTCMFLRQSSENQAPLGSGMVWLEHFEECDPPVADDDTRDIDALIDAALESRKPCPMGKQKMITDQCCNCDKKFDLRPITDLYFVDLLYDEGYACSPECADATEQQVSDENELQRREADIERG